MNLLRREFGLAEPVKRGMELQICRAGEWRPAVLGPRTGGVHEEILAGRDGEMDWEDVYVGEMRERADFHAEMEARCGMNW